MTLKKLDFMGIDLSEPGDRHAPGLTPDDEGGSLRGVIEKVEKRLIADALSRCRWRKGEAAKALGLDPKSLYRKIKKYGLAKE